MLQEAKVNKKRDLRSNTTVPEFSKDLCTTDNLFDDDI